jgi:small ligand-binding sensory domain FIST
MMRFGSGISNAPDWRRALAEAAGQALGGLGGEAPDLALLFTTPHHALSEEDLGREARARLGARVLAGTTAAGVIGAARESEDEPGLSIFAARLPGVLVRPFTIAPQEDDDEPAAEAWREAIPLARGEKAALLLFADPFSVSVVDLLDAVNETWPGTAIVGGIASGGAVPGKNRLYQGDETLRGGAVGVALAGPIEVHTVVSQGCRPVGRHLVITRAEGHVIYTIGGRPALAVLRDVIEGLDERDQRLASRALHVGRVIDERREKFSRGDFLIRNPIGADPESGALAVADTFRAGQTIQLHVRDAEAAGEDLKTLLGPERGRGGAAGALLFSCNGRGRRFFGVENHDVEILRDALGAVPVGGFFCGGEFGPIGGRNFVHGYTSSIAILREPAAT